MSSDPVCPYSLPPFSSHDEDILRLLAMPVTDIMIRHISLKLLTAVGCPERQHPLLTPPITAVGGKFALDDVTCASEWEFPPLEKFLTSLVMHSNVHTSSVLCSMIYLQRILKSLQEGSIKHKPETPYWLAVALFMVASKYNHDAAPSTLHWTNFVASALGLPSLNSVNILDPYSTRSQRPNRSNMVKSVDNEGLLVLDGCSATGSTPIGYLLGAKAMAALERDLLHLLDYDLRFDEEELRTCLNVLSSHPRAEGPVRELKMVQGWPRNKNLYELNRIEARKERTHARAMRRFVALEDGPIKGIRSRSPTPHTIRSSMLFSPPHTPHILFSPSVGNPRPVLNVKTDGGDLPMTPSRYPNPWLCTPLPQLNANMDVDYFSKPIDKSKLRNPFPAIGVPAAPPSTPTAGIESLPFIYGGKVNAPVLRFGSEISGLEFTPTKDSLWMHSQVGGILHKTMARREKPLAAMISQPPPMPEQLGTPPPIPVFGSGFLYLHAPRIVTLEAAPPSKLSISDIQWNRSLGQVILPGELEGGLQEGVKQELEKWKGRRKEGMSAGQREHPTILSPTLPMPGCHPRHFRATVNSGPVERLNSLWDKDLQARLNARKEDGCNEAYQTTKPQRRCEVVSQSDLSDAQSPIIRCSRWEIGVRYEPAPPEPLERQAKTGWLGKFIGRNRRQSDFRNRPLYI